MPILVLLEQFEQLVCYAAGLQWIVISYEYLSIESSSVKAVLSLVCEIFVISFKNGVLLSWLGSRNCTKKTISFLCHFTAHICGYISIIAYMDLTIASKTMLAG